MIIPTNQLKDIIAAGGGLTLDGSDMTFVEMRTLAAAAAGAKVRITIKNVSGFTQEQLKQVAALAPGLVTFDLTSK